MNFKEAKKILPKKEFEAFESILMNQISRTAPAKLKQRATLARKLRDKYRDLAHREAAGVRTRRTNEVDTDINDRRSLTFQKIIDRLEEELDWPRNKVSSVTLTKKKVRPKTATLGDVKDKRTLLEAKRRTR